MPGHKKSRLGIAAPVGGPPGGVRRGNGAGIGGPAKGEGKGPARNYTWDEMADGNTASVVHGASSERFYLPVAQVILEDLLTEPSCPPYLRSPLMKHSLRAWAEAEAQEFLTKEWWLSLPEEHRYEARKQGQSVPFEILLKAQKHAGNLRTQNGLTPVSAARLSKSVTSAGLDLARMAQGLAEAEGFADDDEDEDD